MQWLKTLFLEQFSVAHSYRLPAEFLGKTGQMETRLLSKLREAWSTDRRHSSCRPKCTHTEENVAAVEELRRPATHQTSDVERDGLSQSFVVVTTRRDLILVWSVKRYHAHEHEQNEANRHAFTTPDLWSPNSHDLNPVNYIWGTNQQRVYQIKVHNMNELQQRLIDVWAVAEQKIVDVIA